jgi:methyl-accepting chemotaxis protein
MATTQTTNVEYEVLDTDLIVTKTDLRGNITYVNPDFERVSGYTEKELLGSPHSMVRHSDMPSEAFADLWRTLKNGESWQGFVKNKRKDGGFYWVLANVSPDYNNGQVIGYISIRTKASRESIIAHEKIYQLFKEGRQGNRIIKRGRAICNSWYVRLNFFNDYTIKKRITTVIVLLLMAMTGIGSLGLFGLNKNNRDFQSVYEDRVIPITQVTTIQKLLLQNRLLITRAALEKSPITSEKNTAEVESNIEEITKLWSDYMATYLTPEEKILADKFAVDRKHFVGEGLKAAIATLRAGDYPATEKIITEKIIPLYADVGDGIQKLYQLQVDITKSAYASSQSDFHFALKIIVTIVLLSIAIGTVLGISLFRAIVKPLNIVTTSIMRGEKNSLISKQEFAGEITELVDGFNTVQIKSNFYEAEAKREADANLRIKIGLDNVSASVVIADSNFNMIYLNKAAEKMLQNAESDIRKDLPHFSVSSLHGKNIDVFHKNPAHQRKLLSDLKETITTKIEIGGRALVVVASPVINSKGEHLGSVAEWYDRTNEVSIEKEVAVVVNSAASGDFTRRINESGKSDFILLLSQSVNVLVKTCSDSLSEIVQVLSALSHGDLTQTVRGNYEGTFGQLKDDTNLTVESLKNIVAQIQEVTQAINMGAKEIAAGNNDLSHRTEKQAASLEETAASMQELTSTVHNNAENAKEANKLADEASNIATKGVNVVNQVVTTMADINDSSRKIGDIISVIDDIAFQTNILALNAAVEAARAGEQGKGFAVVAIEVRNLAQRAATAAGEIKILISDSVNKVTGGTKLVTNAGETMGEIVTSIRGVTTMMSEITAASSEQSYGIEQVNKAVGQMDEVTQQNAALVEESAAAAETLEDQVRNLSVTVSRFNIGNSQRNVLENMVSRKITVVPTEKSPTRAMSVSNLVSNDWEEF